MKHFWQIVFFGAIALFWMAGTALADEVNLKNGDRLSGELLRMEGGKLILKTSYAGEVTINWEEVASLSTEKPLKVILTDETAVEGATVAAEAGKMKLDTGKLEEPATFSLIDVQAINPKPKPAVRIKGWVNAGVTSEKGNTDSDDISLTGQFEARTEKSRFTSYGEYYNEKDDGITNTKNWNLLSGYDYFLSEKWFAYAKAQFEHDEFADLDLRTRLSAGVGYQFFETDTLNLNVAAGPGYVDENFIEAPDDSFTTAMWFVNYDQYFFDKFFQLFHRSSGYWSFEDSSDWNIYTRQGIRFPIYRGFTATFQYNYDYDNKPGEATRYKWDSKWLFLLGYQFDNQ
jgi:putative salt-induced outer membrane protein YdiY